MDSTLLGAPAVADSDPGTSPVSRGSWRMTGCSSRPSSPSFLLARLTPSPYGPDSSLLSVRFGPKQSRKSSDGSQTCGGPRQGLLDTAILPPPPVAAASRRTGPTP